MGAASVGQYRVRIHEITDYVITANTVTVDDLKGELVRFHEENGLELLRAKLEADLAEKADPNIVGSYGLEVEEHVEVYDEEG